VKRLSILVVLATMFLLAFSGVAYANFAIHGGYSLDTDACAGCHRAHTSFSELRWANRYDPNITQSALLVSSADTMTEFCNTCHGSDALVPRRTSSTVSSTPARPDRMARRSAVTTRGSRRSTRRTPRSVPRSTAAGSPSSVRARLRLRRPMAWTQTGSCGASVLRLKKMPTLVNFTCTSCHDVHGSSNYRLLKDSLNGQAVGGYLPDGTPQPWVISAEEGYPAGGWLKHEPGAAQMALYRPNYTEPEYAYQPPVVSTQRSMSGWCAGCHQQYIVRESAYDYGMYEAGGEDPHSTNYASAVRRSTVIATPSTSRWRPVVGEDRSLMEEVQLMLGLPLEARPGSPLARGVWDYQDYMSCLTCHRAHGSAVAMSGWAEATIEQNAITGIWGPVLAPGAAASSRRWTAHCSATTTVACASAATTSNTCKHDLKGT
jgi:predicted CXXCH cytochrome family protein